jgi:hypothetical protein
MICKSTARSHAIATASPHLSAMSRLARKTAETVTDFTSVVHNLVMDIRDSYRPELHYMRGPGPKWRAKRAKGTGAGATILVQQFTSEGLN